MAQNRRLSWEKAFEKAYRNLAWDSAQSVAGQAAVERLRDPKAQIVTPGSRSTAPAPPASTDPLAGIRMSDLRDILPEHR